MMRGLSWIIHASLCKVVFHNICLKFSLADWSRLLVDNLSRWPLQVYCWQSRVIPRKIRRSDNASLAHCTLSFSTPFRSKLGYENCQAWMLLDICKTITLRWGKRNDAKTKILYLTWWSVAYRRRLVWVPLLEPIRIQDLQHLWDIWSDTNASLAHTTFDLAISTTANPYCFISVVVSLNSRRIDVEDRVQVQL